MKKETLVGLCGFLMLLILLAQGCLSTQTQTTAIVEPQVKAAGAEQAKTVVDGKPAFDVRVEGWKADEAFDRMAEMGVYVLTLGGVDQRFIAPVDMRRRAVPARSFVEAVADFYDVRVSWWNNGVAAAVLQRGAAEPEVPRALEDLGSASEEIRIDAAWRAGWIMDSRIVPALMKVASDNSRQVARQALASIRRLGWPVAAALCPKEALLLLDAEIERRGRALDIPNSVWMILADACGSAAVPLLQKASEANPAGAKDALERARTSRTSITAFKPVAQAKAPGHSDAETISPEDIGALGRTGGEGSLELIEAALNRTDARAIARQAVRALADIGGDRAFELLALVGRKEIVPEKELADAMAQSGSDRCFTELARLLQYGNSVDAYILRGGRLAYNSLADVLSSRTLDAAGAGAIRAIAAIGGEDLAPKLIPFLRTTDLPAVDSIAFAAERIGGKPGIDITNSTGGGLLRAQTGNTKASATEGLLRIVSAIGSIGGPYVVPLLAKLSTNPDARVRQSSVEALGFLGLDSAFTHIQTALGDSDANVRKAAVGALARLGAAKAVQSLCKILTTRDYVLVPAAADALSLIEDDNDAAAVMMAIISYKNEGLYVGKPDEVIKRLGPRRASSLLRILAPNKTGKDLQTVVGYLVECDAVNSIPAIRRALVDADFYVRANAAGALAKVVSEEADRLVVSLILDENPETGKLGAYALERMIADGSADARPTRLLKEAVTVDLKRVIKAVRAVPAYRPKLPKLLASVCDFDDPGRILMALEKRDLGQLWEFLDRGADVNTRYPPEGTGRTILMEAVRKGDIDIVELLLANRAGLEYVDELGMTALSHAALLGNPEICRVLIDRGASLQAADKNGNTPLLYAVQGGRPEVVRYLIQRGADPLTYNTDRQTCVDLALKAGRIDIVKCIVETTKDAGTKDADLTAHKLLLFAGYFAARAGDIAMLRELIVFGDGAISGDRGTLLLEVAVEARKWEAVRVLIETAVETGASAEKIKLQAVELAIRAGDAAGLAEFISINSSVTSGERGASLLILAVVVEKLEAARVLIKTGVNARACDTYGQTPIVIAVAKADMEMVRLLLHSGADANTENQDGESILMRAVKSDNIDIARLLIDSNAYRGNALDEAVSVEMARLLGAGTSVDDRILLSSNPKLSAQLRDAVAKNDASRVDELLTVVHPDSNNGESQAALLIAARAGNLDMVKKLVSHGVDVGRRYKVSGADVCPIDEALGSGNLAVIDYLLSKGAQLTVEVNVFYLSRLFKDRGGEAVRTALKSGLATIRGEIGNKTFLAICASAPLELIATLVESGADLGARLYTSDSGNYTLQLSDWYRDAVSEAIDSNRPDIAEYLISKGAGHSGYALAAAIRAGHKNLQAILLKAGAPVEGNALVAACEIGDFDLVKKFLSMKINVNLKGYNGMSPAETAYYTGQQEILDLLIKKGAAFKRPQK